MRFTVIRLFFTFFLLGSCHALTAAPTLPLEQQVEIFQQWRSDLSRGRFDAWRDAKQQLGDSALQPYIDYLQLNAELRRWPLDKLLAESTYKRSQKFLDQWAELAVSIPLENQWMNSLGKHHQWASILKHKQSEPSVNQQCLRLRALLAQDQSMQNGVLSQARSLWLSGESRPKSCDPLFDLLNQQNRLSAQDYQARVRLATLEKNYGLARWLYKKLDSQDQAPVRPWIEHIANPLELVNLLKTRPNKNSRQLAEFSMRRVAALHPTRAHELWKDFVRFTDADPAAQQDIWRRVCIYAASNALPQAYLWFSAAQLKPDDDLAWSWYLRSAIANSQWQLVRDLASKKLAVEKHTQYALQFWGAYAAYQQGDTQTAGKEWQALAQARHWYGLLAADYSQQTYPEPNPLPKSDKKLRKQLLKNPRVERAHALHLAGTGWLARGEWYRLLKEISEPLKQEAALYAHEIDWPSMSARTQARVQDSYPDETLYPIAWQPLVQQAASQNQIEAAHILAQMRSESLFMYDVRSGAGALGLMQLMPQTARSVGKQLQLSNWRNLPLLEPATNIQLGSRYIADMMERFDNQLVLATAAYNAGPHRVDKWLSQRDYNDPVLWAELIPFTETRNYVHRSLYFYSIYDRRIQGKSRRLSELLGYQLGSVAQ